MADLRFQIVFGLMAPAISQQLRSHKIKMGKDHIRVFQKTADAITFLRFKNYLSIQAANMARNKLYKEIMKEVSNG
jgi:hypothetical protein